MITRIGKPSMDHQQPKDASLLGAMERIDNPAIISTLIPVGLAFAAIGLYGVPMPGAGVPASTVVLGIAALLSLFARPTFGLLRPQRLLLLLMMTPAWLLVASLLNHLHPTKRLVSLAIWLLVVLVLSSGRLCRISASRGVALGLVAAAIWSLARIPASSYSGRLSGTFGEPNSAGMVLCGAGFAAIGHLSTRRSQLAVLGVLITGIFFTYSRTSYFAVAVMIAWILLSRFFKPRILLIATGIGMYLISRAPETDFATERFAGRVGSDALRGRISDAEHALVSIHPVYGNGAGTAQVQVQDRTFFFHNSYLALRAEGGYIAWALLVLFGIGLLLAMVSLPHGQRNLWLEASLLGIAVCALNLGNVLLTSPAAIVIGMSLRHLAVERRRMRDTHADDSREAETDSAADWAGSALATT